MDGAFLRSVFVSVTCAEQVGDELLCCAAASAGVGHFPFDGFCAQFFARHIEVVDLGEMFEDSKVFFLIRCCVADGDTESIGEGYFFVDGIHAVNVLTVADFVVPAFFDEVATVRGCIDEYVRRSGFDTAVDGRFERFVFDFMFFKRQVVEEDDEFFALVTAEFCHDVAEIGELVFRYLYHAQTCTEVAVYHCFYGRRFACTARTDQERMVRRQTLDEGFCIGDEKGFLAFVADDVVDRDRVEMFDTDEADAFLVAESAITTDLTAAILMIEGEESARKCRYGVICFERFSRGVR